MNRAEFLSYFLWRHQDDDSYLPPAEGALEQALAVATDRIGFEAYQPQFEALVEIVKTDEAQGRWGSRNLKNSPGITRLVNLPPEERAKYVVVAAQILSWFDQCAGLIEARRPRCAIGQDVACTIINLAGKFKGYPPEQLSMLARASASCTNMASNVIETRAKLLQILASHAREIPRDPETRAALAQFLTNVVQFEMPSAADLKAIDKLQPIASGEEPTVEASAKKPKSAAKTSPKTSTPKAVRDSEAFWELPGESELRAATTPQEPQANKQATVRLTHANPYGPFDEAKFFVRIGDPEKPTDQDNPDAATDWVQCKLVEELVHVDGQEMPRAKAKEPFEDETLWEGTYEAKLKMPAERCSIEIKVVSEHAELPYVVVLSDWQIAVGRDDLKGM